MQTVFSALKQHGSNFKNQKQELKQKYEEETKKKIAALAKQCATVQEKLKNLPTTVEQEVAAKIEEAKKQEQAATTKEKQAVDAAIQSGKQKVQKVLPNIFAA